MAAGQCAGRPVGHGAARPARCQWPTAVLCSLGLIKPYWSAVSRVAQAWATLRSGEAFPGNVAQPPFSM